MQFLPNSLNYLQNKFKSFLNFTLSKKLLFIISIIIFVSLIFSLLFFSTNLFSLNNNQNGLIEDNPNIDFINYNSFASGYLKPDIIKSDNVKIEILSSNIIQGTFSREGYEYLDLQIKVSNISNQQLEIDSSFNMEVRDEKGNVYSDASYFTSSSGFIEEVIPVGAFMIKNVSFEVPVDAKFLDFYYFPNFLDLSSYLKTPIKDLR